MSRAPTLVRLSWYRAAGTTPGRAQQWVAAADAHLPEARVQRYGDSEPLRGRAANGDEAFVAAHAGAASLLFVVGSRPVRTGALAATQPAYWGPVVHDDLDVDRAAFEDPDEHQRILAFFVALAEGGLFASASVAREEPHLAPLGTWHGLPVERPAWAWFGPGYTKRVRALPGLRPAAGGLLLDAPGEAWVGAELRARFDEVEPSHRVARWVPTRRRPPWRALLRPRTGR